MLADLKDKFDLAPGMESRRVAVSMLAIMLGSFLFFGAAFAPMTSVHNATHDTRHAFSIPCH